MLLKPTVTLFWGTPCINIFLESLRLFSGILKLIHHPDGEWPNLKLGMVLGDDMPFDISILRLKAKDELDLNIYTPACMARPTDRDSFDNQLATVAGWGFTEDFDGSGPPPFPDPHVPHHVDLTVRPVSVCPRFLSDGVTEYSPSDLCAGSDDGEKDSCLVSLPDLDLITKYCDDIIVFVLLVSRVIAGVL